jgi:hypothetical protein
MSCMKVDNESIVSRRPDVRCGELWELRFLPALIVAAVTPIALFYWLAHALRKPYHSWYYCRDLGLCEWCGCGWCDQPKPRESVLPEAMRLAAEYAHELQHSLAADGGDLHSEPNHHHHVVTHGPVHAATERNADLHHSSHPVSSTAASRAEHSVSPHHFAPRHSSPALIQHTHGGPFPALSHLSTHEVVPIVVTPHVITPPNAVHSPTVAVPVPAAAASSSDAHHFSAAYASASASLSVSSAHAHPPTADPHAHAQHSPHRSHAQSHLQTPHPNPGLIPSAMHAVDANEVQHVKDAALAAAHVSAGTGGSGGGGGGGVGDGHDLAHTNTLTSAARAVAVAAVTAAADALTPAPDVDPDTHDHVAIVLSHHFQDDYFAWEIYSVGRRLLLQIVAAAVPEYFTARLCFCLLLLLFLLIHLYNYPFSHSHHNRMESLSLSTLTLIAAVSASNTWKNEEYASLHGLHLVVFVGAGVVVVMLAVPLFVFCLRSAHHRLSRPAGHPHHHHNFSVELGPRAHHLSRPTSMPLPLPAHGHGHGTSLPPPPFTDAKHH